MAAFLANVGVNSAHPVRSPLHDDGTFDVLPIPEPFPWRPPMVRGWRGRAVHIDPDLTSPTRTYGDNCRRAGRAFSLRRARSGDVIVFLARLVNHQAGFYLVGSLEINDCIADVTADPGPGWWDANAHVRRARATEEWDEFWVFRGTTESRWFARAVPFTRVETERVFGTGLRWPTHRSELQTIGSYTRAVRRVQGAGEEWLRTTCPS